MSANEQSITNKSVLEVMERDAKAASLQRWSDRVPNETLYLLQMDEDAKEARATVQRKFNRLEELEKQAASLAEALARISGTNGNDYFDGGADAMRREAREALRAYHGDKL